MTRWATLGIVLAFACRQEAPAPQPKPQAQSDGQSCLDRQLAAKGLNPFGDPEGTMYPGGTPLFDEKTGRMMPREPYVFAKHPDLARACAADGGP